jgi:hypothetical protein
VDNLEKCEDLEKANEQMRKKRRVGLLNVMESYPLFMKPLRDQCQTYFTHNSN